MAEKVHHTIRAVVELDEAVNFGELPNAIQVIRNLNQSYQRRLMYCPFVYQCSYNYRHTHIVISSLPHFM